MIPDSPEYDKRIAEIRDALPVIPVNTEGHFVRKPRIELVNLVTTKRHWIFWQKEKTIKGIKLLTDMIYWSAELQDWVIELAGVVSDGASVPQVFWSLFPPFGKGEGRDYVFAALGHDKFCRRGRKGISRIDYKAAARIFREMMIVTNTLKRVYYPMYRAVIWGGPKFDAAHH